MTQSVIGYITGGMILITALMIFSRPIKQILKIILRSAVGCGVIYIFNLAKGVTGLSIGLNAATAATVGILGAPGFIMMLLMQYILH